MAGTRNAGGLVLLTAVLLGLAPAAGCNALDLTSLVTARSTVAETFETGAAPQIIVDTFNGSIDVSDGKDDEVVVEVNKQASGINQEAAEAALDEVEVSLVQKDNTIHVSAKVTSGRRGNRGASVVIAAPKGARLQLISSNGHVVCEGMRGAIQTITSNGHVDVVGGTGPIDITTSNGAIEIEASEAAVAAKTSNARIRFSGSLAAGDQKFHTSNGSIRLSLPADSQFKLDAATSNGRIACGFPLDEQGKSRRKLTGTVGEHPTSAISAITSNASIAIGKAGAVDEE